MAVTVLPTGSDLAQKIYSKGLQHQAEVASLGMNLVDSTDEAVVVQRDDFTREKGDTIQRRFSPTRNIDPFLEGQTIEGNESSLDFQKLEWKIGYAAYAFAQSGPMDQQRVNFSLKKAAMAKLAVLWTRLFEKVIFNPLSANTVVNTGNAAYRSFNTITAIDSVHTKFVDDVANAQSLTSANTLDLSIIDQLRSWCESTARFDYPIPPAASGYYYFIMHTDGARQLRLNTGETGWRDIENMRIQGGLPYMDSALAKGFLGIYNNTVLCATDYMPNGINSSTGAAVANTRIAVFCGADAGSIGWGGGYAGDDHLDWREQIRDYKIWGVSSDSVFGALATTWANLSGTNQSYGRITVVHYSAL